MSRINFVRSWVEYEKSFITSGPGFTQRQIWIQNGYSIKDHKVFFKKDILKKIKKQQKTCKEFEIPEKSTAQTPLSCWPFNTDTVFKVSASQTCTVGSRPTYKNRVQWWAANSKILCSHFVTLLIITQIGYNTVILWIPFFVPWQGFRFFSRFASQSDPWSKKKWVIFWNDGPKHIKQLTFGYYTLPTHWHRHLYAYMYNDCWLNSKTNLKPQLKKKTNYRLMQGLHCTSSFVSNGGLGIVKYIPMETRLFNICWMCKKWPLGEVWLYLYWNRENKYIEDLTWVVVNDHSCKIIYIFGHIILCIRSCIIKFIKQVGEKEIKCKVCQAFYRFIATCLINSIIQEHSRQVIYIKWH